jgi:hypothetical protein
MIAAILTLCLGGVSADPSFDAALTAHQKALRASAAITVDSKLDSQAVHLRFGLRYIRPNSMLLEVTDLAPDGSQRTFFLAGAKAVVYDRDNNEVQRQRAEEKGLLVERVLASFGRIDDAVQTIIEPKVMRSLFGRYRGQKNWKQLSTAQGPVFQLTTANGVTKFGFDRRTRLLRRFSVATKGGYLRWNIAYGNAPKAVSYSVPAFAKPVQVLGDHVAPPKYVDNATRKIAHSAVASYDRLKHVEFELVSEGETSHVWISGASVRRRGTKWDWGYDGKTLWVYSQSAQKAWRGRIAPALLGAALAAVGAPIEAYVQQLAQHRNPMKLMLIPGAKAQRIGSIKLFGADCDILEIKSSGLKIAVCLRRVDRLASSIVSEARDKRGSVLAETERTLRYIAVGQASSANRFASQIPAGVAAKPLPKVR